MGKAGINSKSMLAINIDPDDETSSSMDILVATVEAPGVEGYIMGRSDTASNYIPDIDLANYNAQQRGISRRHAALVRYKGAVHVLDLGSMNGTFVNNKRLSPQSIHVLNDGDRLSLANLHLIIKQV